MNPLPKRLRKEPLIEVLWQLQFQGNQGVGDLLSGILFSQLKKEHPQIEWRRLAAADIPAPIAQSDPNLRFAPKMLMEAPHTPFIWQIGNRVLTLNCCKPYVGWDRFKEAVLALTHIVEDSGLLPNPQRHSLRYIDFLQGELAANLSALKLSLRLGDFDINGDIQLRLEIPDGEYRHVVQVATPMPLNLPGENSTGTIIDLETLPANAPADCEALRAQLDHLHDHLKSLFFRQVLTEATIQKLEPEY
ncbi:TIGR04255 family protein [Chloracidobacterium aggregatum]|uniref:TIGR04255 family protein n=1 Tax=Chloracidobacterium sp. N TaxID=2821540 RepID=A0ABX8B784_9BACT|nr:TIGR04255 family protein [Chloracidobacterium aggregatum]QUV95429.1 TIGR04255 family protein [Chloracidobacterium sp. N]